MTPSRAVALSGPTEINTVGAILYVVPNRQLDIARHTPAGRTLHLLDPENLMRGPWRPEPALRWALALYREAVPVALGDHVVMAANRSIAISAGLAWPNARLLLGDGLDGADMALIGCISDLDWVASRYDRVVVGSGDGIFARCLSALRARGVAVGVVAPAGAMSLRLGRVAHFVRFIPDLSAIVGVA